MTSKFKQIFKQKQRDNWVTLLFLIAPALTFPSASPKMISLGRSWGHNKVVTEEEVGNLLQIDFFSPQSFPILYMNTMLSDYATATFSLSGENAIALTTYDFDP